MLRNSDLIVDAYYRNRNIAERNRLEQETLGDPVPDTVDWANGKLGYIQHHPASVQRLREFIQSRFDSPRAACDDPVYGSLTCRLQSTDLEGREWGQPAMLDPTLRKRFGDNEACYEDRRK